MLPQLGEMLSKENLKAAAPFMSACIIVTQLVIAVTVRAWIGKTGCDEGTKAALAPRFRCPSDSRSSLHLNPCRGSVDRHPDARRSGECHIRHCLDFGYQRQDPRDGPLQCGGGNTCDDGWHRGSRKHDNRWRVDSASCNYRASLFLGLAGIALPYAFVLLWWSAVSSKPSLLPSPTQHPNPTLNHHKQREFLHNDIQTSRSESHSMQIAHVSTVLIWIISLASILCMLLQKPATAIAGGLHYWVCGGGILLSLPA